MARLTFERSIYSDNRFLKLIKRYDKKGALGLCVIAWELAQEWYLESPTRLIPEAEWRKDEELEVLVEVGLAERRDGGVYVKGADRYCAFLLDFQCKGKKSAALRNKPKQRNHSRKSSTAVNPGQPTSTSSSSSSSSSSSDSSKKNENALSEGGVPSGPTPTQEFIARYCQLFQERYGVRPLIGKREGGICKRIVLGYGQSAVEQLKNYFSSDVEWFKTKRHDLVTFEQNLSGMCTHEGKDTTDWDDVFGRKA